MSTILGTTTPGMERVAFREGRALLESAGLEVRDTRSPKLNPPGVVCWEVDERPSPASWLVHHPLHAARALYHCYLDPVVIPWDGVSLSTLIAGVATVDFPSLTPETTFRVTCERSGMHAFQSPEVERELGALLVDRYHAPADMVDYAVHIGVMLVDSWAMVGFRLTRKKGLDRRYRWAFHPRITLRTPVAYLMLKEAGFVDSPGDLYDPCCGAGTILLEAGSVAEQAVTLAGSDRERAAAEGARRNMEANGVTATIRQLDINELRPHLEPQSLDYVITNPPYGVRIGKRVNYHLLYQSLLSVAAFALRDGGRLAFLTERREGAFLDVRAHFASFRDISTTVLEIGGLHPRLYLLERTPRRFSERTERDS